MQTKRKVGMTVLISDRVKLKIKSTKQNEEHCVIIKGTYEEETMVIKLHVL